MSPLNYLFLFFLSVILLTPDICTYAFEGSWMQDMILYAHCLY